MDITALEPSVFTHQEPEGLNNLITNRSGFLIYAVLLHLTHFRPHSHGRVTLSCGHLFVHKQTQANTDQVSAL